MADLFEDQAKNQEELWAIQIQECQWEVQGRVDAALALGRAKTKRKELYARWRKEFGDDIARESARLAEAILTGKIQRPKWFRGRC
jgi:hypothetical protein